MNSVAVKCEDCAYRWCNYCQLAVSLSWYDDEGGLHPKDDECKYYEVKCG